METLISDLYFKPVTTERELKACFAMRYKVYCEQKRWLPASRYPDGLEFDKYDEKATHVIAMDEDFNIVGSSRILDEKKYDKLPYLKHPSMKNSKVTLENVVELSRFLVVAKRNRHKVARGMFRVIYQLSQKNNWENWVIVVENSFLRYAELFQLYWEPIEAPAKYFGAITIPANCNMLSTRRLWRKKYPETDEFFKQDYYSYINHKELAI